MIVVGGGISGLSAAWFLARALPPTAKVTVLEASGRAGGWIASHQKNGILAEAGPRTLRPHGAAGTATLGLVHALRLGDAVCAVPRTAAAARNRFVRHNGRLWLLPTTPGAALFAPPGHVFRGVLLRALLEPFVSSSLSSSSSSSLSSLSLGSSSTSQSLKSPPTSTQSPTQPPTDESIASFVARRFGRHVADSLVSALVHGIYAGDARVLSVRACFPFLWDAERKHGSVLLALLKDALSKKPKEVFPPELSSDGIKFIQRIKACSVYAFKNGLQTLTDAIVKDLKQNYPNVSILTNTRVSKIELVKGTKNDDNDSSMVRVTTESGQILESPHVISTISSGILQHVLPSTSRLPALLSVNPAVSVAVVNLTFANPNVLSLQGFGYLVPQTEKSNVIGVIFDSCAIPGQGDAGSNATRLTCMMGGHRFNELFGSIHEFDEAKCLEMARDAIKQDLGITDVPIDTRVTLNKDCITQYTVGHVDRLVEMHSILESEFEGKLSLVGSSFLGVGVNHCVLAAKETVARLVPATPSSSDSLTSFPRVTGLESCLES
ncbi:hypothetical protein BDR26DRAFT_1010480 [Obelidium mucronatum]|nr:hypothetical protein BDR26DRAFT_1010480 [Obelidium mucronatum]